MSPATEALVTIVHGKFWAEDGEGTRYLRSRRPADVRDAAVDLTTFLADETARVLEAALESPGLRAELEAIPDDWGPEHLYPMKAALEASGIL